MECYNHTELVLYDKQAERVAIKGLNSPVTVYTFSGGKCIVNTSGFAQGEYALQYFSGEQVIKQDTLNVKQNLLYASSGYDPRSPAKKTLEAINAYLAGVATHQMRKIVVGDKQIEYSSFEELQKWRLYFEKEVAKEEGKAPCIRHEKLYYRGNK